METTEKRVSRLEIKLDAVDEEVKRLKYSMDFASRSQGDGNLSIRTAFRTRMALSLPKTRMVGLMEEREEEQETALQQIGDCYDEARLW